MMFIFILKEKLQIQNYLNLVKKKLLVSNVLILEVDKRGMLISKDFYNQNDLNKLKFSKKNTNISVGKQSFIYNALSNVRNKINDPLGKKRGTLGR